jgi:multiple sugar transport system permease protein
MTGLSTSVLPPASEPEVLGDEPLKPARARPRKSRKEVLTFFLFISPWLVGFIIFTAIPMIASLVISFTDWDSFQPPNFVGFENYVTLLTDDPLFWEALWHTLLFAGISVPLSLLIALGLAQLMARPMAGARFFRTVIYLPALVPLVAAAMIFRWLLAPEAGPINSTLALFGIDGPAWLYEEAWVIPAVILLALWQIGAGTILLIAALQGVPPELYEAAEIDGAGPTRRFWTISVPLITPILFFNLVTGVIAGFQVFAQVYVMTEGRFGPGNASLMLVPYIYDTAFRYNDMGYAAAMAWILFVIILGFTALIIRSSSSWVFYETEVRS